MQQMLCLCPEVVPQNLYYQILFTRNPRNSEYMSSTKQIALIVDDTSLLQRFMENITPFLVDRNELLLSTAHVNRFDDFCGVCEDLISSIVVSYLGEHI